MFDLGFDGGRTRRGELQLALEFAEEIQGRHWRHVVQVGVFEVAGDSCGRVGEKLHLGGSGLGSFGQFGHVQSVCDVGLQLGEKGFGPVDHLGRNAGQSGYVDTIALVSTAFYDLVEEDDLVGPLADGYVQVGSPVQEFFELGKFVVMRRK